MDACTNPDILRVIWFFLIIIDIVKIIIPIGLIIMGIIDFSKAVVVSDEKVQKKSVSLFMKRLIYAVLIFLVPWIVEVLMITLGNLLSDEINFTDCIENANAETIAKLDAKLDKIEENKEEGLKCWQCNSNSNIYYWGISNPGSSNCPSGWHTLDRYLEEECGVTKCWQCNSPSTIYYWGVTYPSSSSCLSGWHERNIDKSNCK